MIRASSDFGVTARRVEGRHGVWVVTPAGEEKLGALGVHLSRWVASHGFAYNVSTDLRYFDLIVPCGIAGARATSLERIVGRPVDAAAAGARVAEHFAEVFGSDLLQTTREELNVSLATAKESHNRADSMLV
jgi:lipoyl(octanoyl) transferase